VSTSVLLLVVGVGCGVAFAALAVWVQTLDGTKLRRVSWGAPLGLLAVGLLIGGGAYFIDDGQADTTLFEVEAETAAGPREFEVAVEHPGVEHRLWLHPSADAAPIRGGAPAELRVRLDDPSGRPLLEQALVLDVECRDVLDCEWADWSAPFTPTTGGAMRLSVTADGADVALVHLLVEDPEKTDGERAPGY
jgi:hypothetical protein